MSHVRCDHDNLKFYKYVCVTTNQPDTELTPNANHSPTIKQHAPLKLRPYGAIQICLLLYYYYYAVVSIQI